MIQHLKKNIADQLMLFVYTWQKPVLHGLFQWVTLTGTVTGRNAIIAAGTGQSGTRDLPPSLFSYP
jgi:hypothetical protein